MTMPENSAGLSSQTKSEQTAALKRLQYDQDNEIENRALAIQPLGVVEIRENPEITRRTLDPLLITHVQNEDEVEVKYGDAVGYTIKGRLREATVNGIQRTFVLASGGSTGTTSFDPLADRYTIRPRARELFRQDPEVALSYLLHEACHDRYFSMSEAQQRQFDDLFFQNSQLRDALFRFGDALYTDKLQTGGTTAGENYLKVHSIDNDNARRAFLSPDGQKGLKDTRSVVFTINGQRREVFAGELITEFVSYMSMLQMSREVFERYSEEGRAIREGENPRCDAIFLGFRRLQGDPQLKAAFDAFGIYDDNISQFFSDSARLLSENV